MRLFKDLKLDFIEQPVDAKRPDLLNSVRAISEIPIMADESLSSPKDAITLIKLDAVDYFNIKLMKTGITDSLRINAIAEAAGIECMMGCMLESKVGIYAAANVVAACVNITMADTDNLMDIKDDGIRGRIVTDGQLFTMHKTPGIGIDYIF